MNDDSSEFPRERHALSILPVRTPDAYDRMVTDRAPTSAELNALAEARNECTDSEEPVLDAEIACAPQGFRGNHKPLMVGAGYTGRTATGKGCLRLADGHKRTACIHLLLFGFRFKE